MIPLAGLIALIAPTLLGRALGAFDKSNDNDPPSRKGQTVELRGAHMILLDQIAPGFYYCMSVADLGDTSGFLPASIFYDADEAAHATRRRTLRNLRIVPVAHRKDWRRCERANGRKRPHCFGASFVGDDIFATIDAQWPADLLDPTRGKPTLETLKRKGLLCARHYRLLKARPDKSTPSP